LNGEQWGGGREQVSDYRVSRKGRCTIFGEIDVILVHRKSNLDTSRSWSVYGCEGIYQTKRLVETYEDKNVGEAKEET
jgi:hypothetical protein